MTDYPPFFAPPWHRLAGPLAAAEQVLWWLDEWLRHSPIRDGRISRQHYANVAASLWLDGHLVNLVLRDADMNVTTPTPELNEASEILRAPRQAAMGQGRRGGG